MEIQFLADRPEIIPAIACLHQLEMKLGAKSNYQRTIKRFSDRLNRTKLPLALVAFADTLPVGSASLVESDSPHPNYSHLTPWQDPCLLLRPIKILALVINLYNISSRLLPRWVISISICLLGQPRHTTTNKAGL